MADRLINEGYIKAGGHRLRWRTLGALTPTAPTLVFLHEGLGSIRMWKDFPDQLVEATGLPALVYDRWGHGESDALTEPRQRSYRRVEALEVLPEVLSQFDHGPLVLIGHSDGGAMSLLFAAAHPDAVLGIIGLAPQVEAPSNASVDTGEQRPGAGGAMRAVIEAFEAGGLRERLERYHGDNTDSMFYGWANAWSSPEFAGWEMHEDLLRVRCPVTVIQGDRDPYGYRHNIQALERDLASAPEVCIHPEAGHIPHHEARAFTLEHATAAVRRFLSRH